MVGLAAITVEPTEPVRRRDPEKPLPILRERIDRNVRQPLLRSKVLEPQRPLRGGLNSPDDRDADRHAE